MLRIPTIPRFVMAWHPRAVALLACFAIIGVVLGADPPGMDVPRVAARSTSPVLTDPLAATPSIGAEVTGPYAKGELAAMLPPRTDSPMDWQAGLEPLHECGEPRWLPPCIPPPPCHPSCPPQPLDLIGAHGFSTAGPRYRGPCCPRTGIHDDGPFPCMHRLHDRAFDWFYRSK